ncbi:HNH endonuclease [Hyella patelloides LEGE 07179]|uniref:HNH endonuclease n=1 Tax=Hyella patelloides LEGE 07179 TaxID=945734 RepID=A0A563W189_9CYAN|nr:HNH endonuclease signature motif containing protein [Hyella patelloides]VEP17426.1 HNH endonuclease [Hyella patelloides LEGE 07179]
MNLENIEKKNLPELFKLANKIGKKRYHRLTAQDFEDYLQFNSWRYINGDYECGTTLESKKWVKDNSDWYCPICSEKYQERGGKTIDHKLPRSQYPWLSMEFQNLWVICQECNKEKGEKHWYEYEQYIFLHYPNDYPIIKAARPRQLLDSLKGNSDV